jgi:hypothetical protein
MITEYRLYPFKTFIGDIYLQFRYQAITKSIFGREREVDRWVFVPNIETAILGYELYPCVCPKKIYESDGGKYMNCFIDQESFSIIPFTKKYPDIEEYFKERRQACEEYVKKQIESHKLKIKYL